MTCRAPLLMYRETVGPLGRRATIRADGLPVVEVDPRTSEDAHRLAVKEVEKLAAKARVNLAEYGLSVEVHP